MSNLKQRIITLQKECLDTIQATTNLDQLETIRNNYLGRKGHIADLMSTMKDLTPDEKREFGPLLNQLKTDTHEAYEQKKELLFKQKIDAEHMQHINFDVSAYHATTLKPRLHIYTQIIEQLEDIFMSMGYQVADGPEVETDYYNFETLNIPKDHPARDMHDTFWLNVPGMLMRTHTSTIQIHAMEDRKPPLAIFAPGRVYRNEAIDASHNFMFMQAEGLFIDKNVSMSHLLATAQQFLEALFEKKIKIRVRPGFFPFVEPGVEIDAQCPFCQSGCSVCKKTTWIELLGAGLVHPNVLRCSGIDPEEYSGFAFGFGLDRLAIIKHKINDIRLFKNNKTTVLDQF